MTTDVSGSVKLLLATRSVHKLRELRDLLDLPGLELVSLSDVGIEPDPVEDDLEVYDTFTENARAKAVYFGRLTGMPTLADDSGLCVDALDGGPGVRTKRFAPDHLVERYGRDEANNVYLVQRLEGIPHEERGAHYVCAFVLLDGETETAVRGEVHGHISEDARGEGGFGYDPLFLPEGSDRTFAELPEEFKSSTSHRARAAAALIRRLRSQAASDC